uniref:Trafficking protein particle complex subunit 2-like protein n=1 Tax=Panagrolaimus sp. JU765 TaxID=591449 RepID=A0AC34QL46_9BILA
MVLCISILAADSPLYFKCASGDMNLENDIRLFVYSSLDVFDEKVAAIGNKPHQELFLGSLFLNNKFRSYGYLTNTQIKFMIVVDATNQSIKEQDMRVIFKKIHTIYSNIILNPFYELGTAIKSRELDALITDDLTS